jgi:hypothetical protein
MSKDALATFLKESQMRFRNSAHFDALVLCLLQADGHLPPVVLDDSVECTSTWNFFFKQMGCTTPQRHNIIKRMIYCSTNGVRLADGSVIEFDTEPFGTSLHQFLHEIVDMMRQLRSSQARRHVREEIPFYTGRLIDAATAVDILR